jgi:uncharacterized lipoprotein YmbA
MKGEQTMARCRNLIVALTMSFALAACSSSPPVRYYTLSPIDAEFSQDSDNAVLLGLGPFRMPAYLDRSQIVTRGINSELQVDEFNRWSEPLATALLRIVSSDIDNLLPGVVVVIFPYDAIVREQVKFRLVGDIARFDADHLGRIVLEVQWGVSNAGGEIVVPIRRNRYQAQATRDGEVVAGDPGAVAAAMNDVLAQFSRDVAARLQPEI